MNIEDLRRLARSRLPRAVFDFFDGGAEDETTLRGNRAAFERVRLLPRVLVDVHAVDTGVELLGARAKLPMAIAPTGAIGAGRHDADLMLARAACAAGIPYTLATPATNSIEEIAEQQSPLSGDDAAHLALVLADIARFLDRTDDATGRTRRFPTPPGAPIGDGHRRW